MARLGVPVVQAEVALAHELVGRGGLSGLRQGGLGQALLDLAAGEFLKDGDKVKISIRFRGREIGHSKVGMQIMEDFAKATEEFGTVDKQPKMEGKSLVMFLAPKN